VWNDLRWYIQRKGSADTQTLRKAVNAWFRLMAPFAPFTCEEAWSLGGEEGFISVAEWPRADLKLIDKAAEEQENFIIHLIEDTLNILKATKIAPKHVFIYTAAPWKFYVYRKILSKAQEGEVGIGEVMRELAGDAELKPHMKDVASFVTRVTKSLTKLSADQKINALKNEVANEQKVVEDAIGFLRDRLKAEISVYREDDAKRYDPKGRAGMALPSQPAIFIE